MGKMSEALKDWRKKQPRGAIMKPETFSQIEAEEKAKGLPAGRAEKAAGAAYWQVAKSKFAKRKGKK